MLSLRRFENMWLDEILEQMLKIYKHVENYQMAIKIKTHPC